jgi:large subunit ribosomal protein L3
MAKFILGIKQKMSQIFEENGNVMPITLIKAGPVVVTQIKTKDRDGYEAVQVGFGNRNPRNVKKPQKGHLKKARIKNSNVRYMKEFRPRNGFNLQDVKLGDIIDVSVFQEGDKVQISGISKGKGFQGVVKRHGFHGGPRTHGQKHSEREPGSIGATGPQRVLKGQKMPGRMGFARTTVKNLKIVRVDKKNNLLAVSGAVPGPYGTLLEIRG